LAKLLADPATLRSIMSEDDVPIEKLADLALFKIRQLTDVSHCNLQHYLS
jgi:hypothetical protein